MNDLPFDFYLYFSYDVITRKSKSQYKFLEIEFDTVLFCFCKQPNKSSDCITKIIL